MAVLVTLTLFSVIVFAAILAPVVGIAVCPGEGARYGDHKCNHDPTHRVCARLLDDSGVPLNWGEGNFWKITGQTAFQWDDEIRANGGDSWCICMWATADLISSAGCNNVHINCDASDVSYVLNSYKDGGVDLAPAKECLQKKCPGIKPQQLNDAQLPVLRKTGENFILAPSILGVAVLVAIAALGLVAGSIRILRTHGGSEDQHSLLSTGVQTDGSL